MIKPVKLPRGVANIFMLGNSSEVKVMESWNHRPDKILELVGQKSMKYEIINNYMSNTSPISLKNGDKYIITDRTFGGYFFNG